MGKYERHSYSAGVNSFSDACKGVQTFAISVALTAENGDPPTEAEVSLTIRDGNDVVYTETVTVSDGEGSTPPDIQLPAGSYTVSASYAVNDQYEGSDYEYTQEVERDDVTGTITVVPSDPTAGDQVQISINVQAASTEHVVDGEVQLIVDGVDVGGPESLTDGSYTTNYTFTTVGNIQVMFKYLGSDDYNPKDFTETVQVQAIPTTLSIGVNPEPSWIGQSTQLQFTITPENNVGPIEGNITVTMGDAPPVVLEVTDGSANIDHAFPAPAGTVTISATFDPKSGSPYGGSENEVDHEVVLIPTTTLLTLVPENSSMVGENIVFKATVTAADGSTVEVGSVAFYYDGVLLYDENVVDGQLTYDNSFISAGEYVFRAVYTAAGNYEGSESQQNYLIERYGVEVTIEPSKNPSLPGENVNFTVIVNGVDSGNLPSPPGGNVTLSVGPTQVGSKLLSEGQALFENISLTEGDHEITASYEGDADYLPGEGQLTQMVVKGDVAVVLTVDPTETTEGNQITFSVQVSPVAPNTVTPQGTVVLYADNTGNQIGDATLDEDGKAVISYSALPVGTHTVWAVYEGSPQYNTNKSDEIAITITQTPREPTETTIVQDVTLSLYGAPVTFTAMVTAQNEGVQNPTSGTVTFYRDGVIVIGTEDLDGENNTAQITTDTLPPGKHNITAYYGGNNEYDESISDPIQHKVQAETVTTVTPIPPSPSPAGQTVTFTITVRTKVGSPYIPQGEVRLYIDGASPGSATLNGEGTANIPHTFNEAGTYTYYAKFIGDEEEIYLPSESDSAEYVVIVALPELTLTSNYNPSWYGQMVTFTAQVDPAQQGVVTFIIDGKEYATVPVGENGTAQLKIATLAPGYHQVIASFTRDSITLTASLTQVVYYCCRN